MFKRILLVLGVGLVALAPTVQPAQATGNDAVVTVEVLVNGDIEVTSTKDLSNVHIAVCVEGEVQVVKFDSLNDKVEVFDVDGNLIAVLAHSGNNTTAEAEALLKLLGGSVNGNSTGTIVFFDEEALENCVPETTTTTEPPTTTTTEPPVVTTTTQPPVTTTTEPPVTPTTVNNPVVGPVDVPVVTPVDVPAPVDAPVAAPVAELPHTGGEAGILLVIGGGLLLAGLILWGLSKLGSKAA